MKTILLTILILLPVTVVHAQEPLAGAQLAPYLTRVGASLLDTLLSLTIVGFFVNVFLLARQGPQNGMTVGKQVVGIRVARQDGQPVQLGLAIVRQAVAGLVPGLLSLPGTHPTAAPSMAPVEVPPGASLYKFVILETTKKGRALRRYNQLLGYQLNIKMDQKDSSYFKLYFPIAATIRYTTHIKDSLVDIYAAHVTIEH